MTEKEKTQRKEILKELIREIHMPSFCDEEGRCDALDECTDTGEYDCSCCNINRVVKAFNRGIEFQKQKSPWISVEDDLPCNHEELMSKYPFGYKKKTVNVLTFLPNGNVVKDSMGYREKWWNGWQWDGEKWEWESLRKPTHWVPIPKLPKE